MTPARNLSVTRRSASSAFKQASSAFALSRSVTTSRATAVTHRATATVRLSVISSLIGMTGDLRITLLETFKLLARLCPPGGDQAPAHLPKLKLVTVARDQHCDRSGRGNVVARLQVHGRLRQPVKGNQLRPGVALG